MTGNVQYISVSTLTRKKDAQILQENNENDEEKIVFFYREVKSRDFDC